MNNRLGTEYPYYPLTRRVALKHELHSKA